MTVDNHGGYIEFWGDEWTEEEQQQLYDVAFKHEKYFDKERSGYNYYVFTKFDNRGEGRACVYTGRRLTWFATSPSLQFNTIDEVADWIYTSAIWPNDFYIVEEFDEVVAEYKSIHDIAQFIRDNESRSHKLSVVSRYFRERIRCDHWLSVYDQLTYPNNKFTIDFWIIADKSGESEKFVGGIEDIVKCIVDDERLYSRGNHHLWWIGDTPRQSSIKASAWIKVYRQIKDCLNEKGVRQ